MLGWAGLAQAAAPLTPSERTVCKSVKHCVDIVNRHAPDEYDYSVLHGEFLRFGEKGKAALLSLLSGKDKTDMRRAQSLLAKGRFRFTPDEQRAIAALWPRGDLDTHAAIMRQALSPLMRARMIDTLGHEDVRVRTISRDIITATVAAKMDFPLRPADYGKLTRGVLSEPTPALVELLSIFDAEKTAPVFRRLLKSGDTSSTIAAYQKLYAQDQKAAFEYLVGTFYDLKETDAKVAFALAAMLRERHKSREDGFYLKFAKDIAQDPKMNAMGRLAGFDTVMRSNDDAPLFDKPVMSVLKTALANMDSPAPYLRNVPRQAKDNPDPWFAVFWQDFKPKASDDKLNFIRLVGGFETDGAKVILREALGDKRDWRIIQAAAIPLGRMRDKTAVPTLESLTRHPIISVQVAALTALDGIRTGQMKGRPEFWQMQLTARAGYCVAETRDFKDEAKALPFFALDELDFPASGDRRHYVNTITAMKNGFLVGFSAGAKGGDLRYYDNVSGESIGLKDRLIPAPDFAPNITAIMPVNPPPLGQYTKSFWVVIEDGGVSEQARLYKLTETDRGFQGFLQAQLPRRNIAFSPQKNGDIFMSFYQKDQRKTDINPPLLLSSNGAIRRACAPKADTAEALP